MNRHMEQFWCVSKCGKMFCVWIMLSVCFKCISKPLRRLCVFVLLTFWSLMGWLIHGFKGPLLYQFSDCYFSTWTQVEQPCTLILSKKKPIHFHTQHIQPLFIACNRNTYLSFYHHFAISFYLPAKIKLCCIFQIWKGPQKEDT